ncbi:MAG: UPF0182 family protein [Vicinamibacterales bacterium]
MNRPARILGIGAVVLLVIAIPSVLRFYTDWLWFSEIGFQAVFITGLRAQGTVFALAFAMTALWMMVNLRTALRAVSSARPVFTTREGIQVSLPGRQQLQTMLPVVALIVALFVGLFASSEWETWWLWRNAVPFGQADPILNRDAGFYVFTLPAILQLQNLARLLVVLAALTSGALYFVSGSLTTGFPARFVLSPAARRHLSLLAAAFLALLAVGAWLSRASHLIEPSTLFTGPSYADVYARMPAAILLTVVAAIGAALALWQAVSSRNWPIPLAAVLYVVATIGGEVYSGVLQRFVVTPNEQVRESPFIQHNIDATRRAFALDSVEAQELSGDALLTRDDIARNATTLDNVRLWDHQPLLDTFGQIQEIRTYYDFVSVDNDRYLLNGQSRQVMLSARELNSASLPNRTWVNERMTFTHGYGLTLGPVNQVTSEGLPELFVRNLPPETIPDLQITEPSIYFGELSNDYVIVKTATREFHYPRGDDNVFTTYAGRGGVSLGTLFRKLIFAFRFGAYQMVLSDDIGPESRILFHRNIRERVQAIAPFLSFDRDPYMVIADGRLVWLYDAYTISGRYPYSTAAVGGLNYIRNSVKVAIDAYDGTTTFYLADANDPIVATYARIFPTLFRPLAEMPASLRAHVRYPEDIFGIQAAMYATYHMTQPAVFYNREDQWEVPTIEQEQNAAPMQPYYTIMRLPGEQDAEFIQMLPYTPRRKDNLAAWLVARSDGEHYGKLGVFQFPKQKVIFGPRQVVARISQDQTISPQITLWNQQGSQIIWGTLMVIPIEESLIYVRPLYLRASGGRIPELTRVIVVYQNQIVMERTLDEGLMRLFGEGAGAPQATPANAPSVAPQTSTSALPSPGTPTGDLAVEARQHYERAMEAQRAGDWAKYGEEIRLLGESLSRLQQRR